MFSAEASLWNLPQILLIGKQFATAISIFWNWYNRDHMDSRDSLCRDARWWLGSIAEETHCFQSSTHGLESPTSNKKTEKREIHSLLFTSFSLRRAEYTVRNVETTPALFSANTPTKEFYTWLYPQALLFILFKVSSYPFLEFICYFRQS